MGKLTLKGPVPKDDPMFSTGPEMFSRRESRKSSSHTAESMSGATEARSSSAADQSVKERLSRMTREQIEELAKSLL